MRKSEVSRHLQLNELLFNIIKQEIGILANFGAKEDEKEDTLYFK